MSNYEIAASSIVRRHPLLIFFYLAFHTFRILALVLHFMPCSVPFLYQVEPDMVPLFNVNYILQYSYNLKYHSHMQSPELVLCNKTERVTIFKIPPLSTSKGYYLDDWKEMIWEGGVKVTEKNRVIKITFLDKNGKLFGETKVPHNYKQAIVKTIDSSRGYAVRLQNPKGGYLWVGVAFRDRNDAFDFGVVFQDEANRNKISENPNMLNEEFGEKVDFSLKQGGKVKINVNTDSKKPKKQQTGSFPTQNPFSFDFGFQQAPKPQQPKQPKQPSNNDWASFDFGGNASTSTKPTNPKSSNNQNLLDFD